MFVNLAIYFVLRLNFNHVANILNNVFSGEGKNAKWFWFGQAYALGDFPLKVVGGLLGYVLYDTIQWE
jgi:hypothetical protein